MEFEFENVKPGTGSPCGVGDVVRIRSTMWLAATRKLFEKDGEHGLTVVLCIDHPTFPRMLRGMEQGTVGMQVGGIRKLWIPYPLAYGEKGARAYDEDRKLGWLFPPKSDFIVETELVEVIEKASRATTLAEIGVTEPGPRSRKRGPAGKAAARPSRASKTPVSSAARATTAARASKKPVARPARATIARARDRRAR